MAGLGRTVGPFPLPAFASQVSVPSFGYKEAAAINGGAPAPPVLRGVTAVLPTSAELKRLLIESAIALAIMAVVSIGLGWAMAGRALRPLRTMTASARQISEENLRERLVLDGPQDEMKDLGETINGLLGRLETAFESQRRFVANASHELRTPLAMMRTSVDVALGKPRPSDDVKVPCWQARRGPGPGKGPA